jgi:hypothetical protein
MLPAGTADDDGKCGLGESTPSALSAKATTFEAAPAPTSFTAGVVIVESNRMAPCSNKIAGSSSQGYFSPSG